MEAIVTMAQQGDVVARFQKHLAGNARAAHLGKALQVGVEDPAKAGAAMALGDHNAVDIQETLKALLEPAEVGARVVGILGQRDQKADRKSTRLNSSH